MMNFRANVANLVQATGMIVLSVSGCATHNDEASWAGYGYLNASQAGEPKTIGYFSRKSDCEKAIAAWQTQQVVGNPVSAVCLPADRS